MIVKKGSPAGLLRSGTIGGLVPQPCVVKPRVTPLPHRADWTMGRTAGQPCAGQRTRR